MALSEAQFQTVLDHLQENTQLDGCPTCGTDLTVDKRLAIAPILENAQPQSGTGFPMIVVTCKACGNTLFFNARVVGIDPTLA